VWKHGSQWVFHITYTATVKSPNAEWHGACYNRHFVTNCPLHFLSNTDFRAQIVTVTEISAPSTENSVWTLNSQQNALKTAQNTVKTVPSSTDTWPRDVIPGYNWRTLVELSVRISAWISVKLRMSVSNYSCNRGYPLHRYPSWYPCGYRCYEYQRAKFTVDIRGCTDNSTRTSVSGYPLGYPLRQFSQGRIRVKRILKLVTATLRKRLCFVCTRVYSLPTTTNDNFLCNPRIPLRIFWDNRSNLHGTCATRVAYNDNVRNFSNIRTVLGKMHDTCFVRAQLSPQKILRGSSVPEFQNF